MHRDATAVRGQDMTMYEIQTKNIPPPIVCGTVFSRVKSLAARRGDNACAINAT